MTNHCYNIGVYNMYCAVGDPVESFAERLPYYRKMTKIHRLLKVTVPLANLVLPKIYKMESVMESVRRKIRRMVFQRKLHMMEYSEHCITYRIMRFTRIMRKCVMAISGLNTPSWAALMVALTVLDGCALCTLIAILN